MFHWTREQKNVDRRGAGPMDASLFGRGAGEGLGVHICTGPVFVRGAEPGDVLEIRILDVRPRPAAEAGFAGRAFGSNAAAWWGYHYNDLLTEPKPREVITIYEIDATGDRNWAEAVYSYRWVPQTDPSGVVHPIIDYPGVPVDPATIERNFDVLKGVRVPIRPHFGTIAVSPGEPGLINTIPPGYFGGNIDNWRIGKGATLYLPVSVDGRALLGRRFARLAGRLGALRHGDRVLAHRTVPADRPQERRASPARRSRASTIRSSRPRTSGSSTASPMPTISMRSAKAPRPTSSPNPRSTAPCATPSARCAASS